jgi:hypothetical protein
MHCIGSLQQTGALQKYPSGQKALNELLTTITPESSPALQNMKKNVQVFSCAPLETCARIRSVDPTGPHHPTIPTCPFPIAKIRQIVVESALSTLKEIGCVYHSDAIEDIQHLSVAKKNGKREKPNKLVLKNELQTRL